MSGGNILVRSSIHLPEIGLGATGWVDPSAPYVAGCLEKGYLVPVEGSGDVGHLDEADLESDETTEEPVGSDPEIAVETPSELALGLEPAPDPEPEPEQVELLAPEGAEGGEDIDAVED